jgi:Protein of unknown function (DUF3300)
LERVVIINRAILLYAATCTGLCWTAQAQAPQDAPVYQQQQPPDGPRLSPQDLSNLVSPIALYPDMLLSQVLAASTYPAEITQAQQWMQQNPGLRGRQLVDAAKQQNWDPSVQALVAFPDVMNLLTRDMQWTTDLGNAFLAQQADVMDAIQRLRASARDNGRLTNTPQQRVTYEQQNGQNAIVIQPTDPQVVYPPVYNPAYVWGPPVYGVYPPLGYPAIGYGISYAVGTFLGALFTGLLTFGGWGWGLSWLAHGLFLNGLFFSHFGFHGYGGYGFHSGYGYSARAAWVHDPGHRLGVPYGNRSASARSRGGFSGGGWARSGAQNNGAGHAYNAAHSGFAGSSYQGSSRQMEAYRGLSAGAARAGGSNYSHYSAPAYGARGAGSQSGYRGGYSNGGGYSGNGSTNRGFATTSRSESRSSGKSFSSGHHSAPKSSGHSGGGHFGGHSHSGGGGGHSHGGSHKK